MFLRVPEVSTLGFKQFFGHVLDGGRTFLAFGLDEAFGQFVAALTDVTTTEHTPTTHSELVVPSTTRLSGALATNGSVAPVDDNPVHASRFCVVHRSRKVATLRRCS